MKGIFVVGVSVAGGISTQVPGAQPHRAPQRLTPVHIDRASDQEDWCGDRPSPGRAWAPPTRLSALVQIREGTQICPRAMRETPGWTRGQALGDVLKPKLRNASQAQELTQRVPEGLAGDSPAALCWLCWCCFCTHLFSDDQGLNCTVSTVLPLLQIWEKRVPL
jgi:hypothetical protein